MAYLHLLNTHSILRWLVVLVLAIIVFRSMGARSGGDRVVYGRGDNILRTLAVIFSHTQLVIGLGLYFMSPIMKAWMEGNGEGEGGFFGIIHAAGMVASVVLVTIGSSKTRKAPTASEKFKAQMVFMGLALLIILLVIPWPFHPLAQRPWVRSF